MADARVDVPASQPAPIGPASHQAHPQPLVGPGDGARVVGLAAAGMPRGPDANIVAVEEDRLVAEAQGKHKLREKREAHGNMLELATEAMCNRELQFLGRHIFYSIGPLYDHYLASIPAFVHSPMSVARWHAKRAAGDWQELAQAMVRILTSPDLLEKCGVGGYHVEMAVEIPPQDEATAVARAAARPPHAAGSHGVLCDANCEAEDLLTLRTASLLRNVLCQVSALAWCMWPFQRCLPDAFAAILHVDRDIAQGALNRIRRQWEGLQRLVEQPGHEALVKDVFWAGTNPLVHESMCICHRNGWQSGRNEVKRMAYEQWAPIADTKRVLEDVFGALKHEASRNKNCKMSRAHAFFEATLCKALHPKPTNMDDKDKDPPRKP